MGSPYNDRCTFMMVSSWIIRKERNISGNLFENVNIHTFCVQ
jgi:hypothetical protein